MGFINAISYYLPNDVLTNDVLNTMFPEWSVDKIALKTGIHQRHIAGEAEYASTMAVKAAKQLFEEYKIDPSQIDFILLCTQSPDYFLPTTACLVQEELGIPSTCGALDYNLGCSGFTYGLGLAKGLLLSEDADNVLLITAETYSKYLLPSDKSVRTIFGDAATATLISQKPGNFPGEIGRLVYGTDGKGAQNLIVKSGAARKTLPENGRNNAEHCLHMNGPEIFSFTLKRVPEMVEQLLLKNNVSLTEIDLFVFHQANKYMLEHLMNKMNIPPEKFFIHLDQCGNTVSSTIPIALKEAINQGKIKPGMKVMLSGFGVGYSWSATTIQF